jgi:dihydrofolate synthase/folylpolyglutamate synthase
VSEALDAWLARIEARHPLGIDGIDLGLARVDEVFQRLALTCSATTILVGGTNGKGSTCAMLDAILSAAGYRTGRYSSPHLLRFNERVRIGGQAIDDASLVAAFEKVEAARGETELTYFEFTTLAAWCIFAGAGLDALILEVGLGGRLDATNIFPRHCSVITTIDLDHMQWLGPDREAIGREKAGIFLRDVPAICGEADPPQSMLAVAAAVGAPLLRAGIDFGHSVHERQWAYWTHAAGGRGRAGLAFPALRGRNQLANASTALAALDAVSARLPVAMKDVRQGLLDVEIAGRFQVVPGRPTVVLDVAHNAESVRALKANLGDMAFHPRTLAVFGMMADKDIAAAMEPLLEVVTRWFPCQLPGRRPASADSLAEQLVAHGAAVAGRYPSSASALAAALGEADEADRIIVFGSFLTVADALQHLGRPA